MFPNIDSKPDSSWSQGLTLPQGCRSSWLDPGEQQAHCGLRACQQEKERMSSGQASQVIVKRVQVKSRAL
eukprot:9888971-Prorocentrum_lima.AAC.1